MRKRKLFFIPLLAATCCLLGAVVYYLPPVHERLGWRVANLRTQIFYWINPPQEAVFVPQGQQTQVSAIVAATLQALAPAATPTLPAPASPTATQPGPTDTPQPTPTATPPPTPIPEKVVLSGITHEYQQMNNCGPATLAMALSFWGWQGDQRETRAYLRPRFAEVDDKNVDPQEMARYVTEFTGMQAVVRYGGDVDLLKRLVAAGFPVIVEKGFQPAKEDWMGHYQVVNGYDDGRGRFITQDAYIMADLPLPYADLGEKWWRDFNYVYLVIYPPERLAEMLGALGQQADEVENLRYAAQKALDETTALEGRDQFFAWYNLGTSLTALGDYLGAAQAYDQAFGIYPQIPEKDRPWRMLWYQTGAYTAYYHSGRYQDVIDLANNTLAYLAKPILEESLYWRGLAKEALGDAEGAAKDLVKAAELNPNFTLAAEALQQRGIALP